MKVYVHAETCVQMFVAAFFFTEENLEATQKSIDIQMNTLWYIHITEFLFSNNRE